MEGRDFSHIQLCSCETRCESMEMGMGIGRGMLAHAYLPVLPGQSSHLASFPMRAYMLCELHLPLFVPMMSCAWQLPANPKLHLISPLATPTATTTPRH